MKIALKPGLKAEQVDFPKQIREGALHIAGGKLCNVTDAEWAWIKANRPDMLGKVEVLPASKPPRFRALPPSPPTGAKPSPVVLPEAPAEVSEDRS